MRVVNKQLTMFRTLKTKNVLILAGAADARRKGYLYLHEPRYCAALSNALRSQDTTHLDIKLARPLLLAIDLDAENVGPQGGVARIYRRLRALVSVSVRHVPAPTSADSNPGGMAAQFGVFMVMRK